MTYSIYCTELITDDEISAIDGCDTVASLEMMSTILKNTSNSRIYFDSCTNLIGDIINLIYLYYQNEESTCILNMRGKCDEEIEEIFENNLNDDNTVIAHCSELEWVEDQTINFYGMPYVMQESDEFFLQGIYKHQCKHANSHIVHSFENPKCYVKITLS